MGFPKAAHKSETPNKKQNKSKPTASAAGVALNEGECLATTGGCETRAATAIRQADSSRKSRARDSRA